MRYENVRTSRSLPRHVRWLFVRRYCFEISNVIIIFDISEHLGSIGQEIITKQSNFRIGFFCFNVNIFLIIKNALNNRSFRLNIQYEKNGFGITRPICTMKLILIEAKAARDCEHNGSEIEKIKCCTLECLFVRLACTFQRSKSNVFLFVDWYDHFVGVFLSILLRFTVKRGIKNQSRSVHERFLKEKIYTLPKSKSLSYLSAIRKHGCFGFVESFKIKTSSKPQWQNGRFVGNFYFNATRVH